MAEQTGEDKPLLANGGQPAEHKVKHPIMRDYGGLVLQGFVTFVILVLVWVVRDDLAEIRSHSRDTNIHDDQDDKRNLIQNEIYKALREMVPPKEVTARLRALEAAVAENHRLIMQLVTKRNDRGK